MRRRLLRVALQVLAGLLPAVPVAAAPGLFSSNGLEGWMKQTFTERAPVGYRLVRDGGVRVLEADCMMGASGWLWDEAIDLNRTPVLSWRWKVDRLPDGAAERTVAGDDFAARVYVVLRTGFAPWEARSLVYVWAREEPAGADWPSAYTPRAINVALRSGRAEAGVWREEHRDLRADFRRFLGIESDVVHGVALMTDCDDGGGKARAAYGDIHLRKALPGP